MQVRRNSKGNGVTDNSPTTGDGRTGPCWRMKDLKKTKMLDNKVITKDSRVATSRTHKDKPVRMDKAVRVGKNLRR